MSIDIFCQVIDNYGDIGVCWRLAQQLAQQSGAPIRLFVDDLASFSRIEPAIQTHRHHQTLRGITVSAWQQAHTLRPATFVIESFGCELPTSYVAAMPGNTTHWVNLEYLSAEDWVASCHGMPSPQPNGLIKTFFFPGFTSQTGGLLRPTLPKKLRPKADAAFWQRLGLPAPTTEATALLFCYPNAPIDAIYSALAQDSRSWTVLLAATVPAPRHPTVPTLHLPYLAQSDFDILLDSTNLNIVRGEDSFVRALWAATPFIWQPYPQSENTHLEKLQAWLAHTPFEAAVHTLMRDVSQGSLDPTALASLLRPFSYKRWQQHGMAYAQHLATHADLATQLLLFRSKTL